GPTPTPTARVIQLPHKNGGEPRRVIELPPRVESEPKKVVELPKKVVELPKPVTVAEKKVVELPKPPVVAARPAPKTAIPKRDEVEDELPMGRAVVEASERPPVEQDDRPLGRALVDDFDELDDEPLDEIPSYGPKKVEAK